MAKQEITAIVVGYVNYGEADRIVKLLSPELGIISALAKGSRASQKRFAGAIDLGNKIEALVRPGQGKLWKITEATVLTSRYRLRNQVQKIALLNYLCEITSHLCLPENPSPKLFKLIEVSLEQLEEFEQGFGVRYRIAYESKVLSFAGLQPTFLQCLRCEKQIEDQSVKFFPIEGGAIHSKCINPPINAYKNTMEFPVTREWLRAAEKSLRTPLKESIGESMPNGPQWSLCNLIENHLNQRMKSKDFLSLLENS
jgi:DNA repair protein RecO (recombination protein O)